MLRADRAVPDHQQQIAKTPLANPGAAPSSFDCFPATSKRWKARESINTRRKAPETASRRQSEA
eukprot:11758929-Alexandrium_andersonii.AAC.1